MRKVRYVCDWCGTEHEVPLISLWLNRADATLKLQVLEYYPRTVIGEDGLLNFCNPDCLKEYFADIIQKEEQKERPK